MRKRTIGPRQAEVWRLVAEGLPNKLIAHEMGIEENTVKAHMGQLMKAIKCNNRAQLALEWHGIAWRKV